MIERYSIQIVDGELDDLIELTRDTRESPEDYKRRARYQRLQTVSHKAIALRYLRELAKTEPNSAYRDHLLGAARLVQASDLQEGTIDD